MRKIPRVCFLALVLVLGSCTGSDVEVATTTTTTGPVIATTPVASTTTTTEPPQLLTWTPCGSAECAKLTVPLDHDDPSQGTIDLAVARRLAQRPEERVGVLFYQPGSVMPGTPVIIDEAGFWLSSTLLDRFDVVSWDRRGISETSRVNCVDNPEELLIHDPTPETIEEELLIVAGSREFAVACADRSGDLLPHLSTVSTAHDLDLLRAALGEEQFSYLGVSYGTALGSTYATLFPARVRAMVLDAAFDLSAPWFDWAVQKAEAQERALTFVLEQCAADSSCPFRNDGDPFTAFDELMARLDAEPIVVGDVEVGLGHAKWAVITGLEFEWKWSDLIQALASAQDGNGHLLRDLGLPPPRIEGLIARECLDYPRSDWEPSQSIIDTLLAVSPRLGRYHIEEHTCEVWPVEPDPPPPLTGTGAGPILVVGNTGDTSTPLQSNRALANQLEEGVLLIVESNDHSAYWSHPDNLCVLDTVDRYLTDLELPANESRCILGDPQLHPPS